MFEMLPDSNGNCLGLKASEKLTVKDYKEVLIPRLEAIIERYGRVRMMLFMGEDFHGFEIGAILEDAKFGLKHRGYHVERMAAVGAPKWLEWCMKISSYFIKGEYKTYPADKMDEAWQWTKG